MDAQLFLRTLGVPALFAPNGNPIRFRVKKHVALLVYLAVERWTAHRRDHLVDLLWPRASAAEGRHSLSTALSVLRGKLGRRVIETSRDTIRLADGAVAVDLARLESGEVLADEARPELDVAAFLDGFDVADADEFLRWRERQQARLLPAILKAMVVLIDRCRRTADSRTMERLADRMMVLDPLSEDAVRAKMESRAFDGDRLTALRVFEEWKDTLARELAAVPSDLVEGIAIRLRRRGWERSANDRIPSVRTDQWRGRPFIGRQAEYRVLYEGWERTQRGEPGHALVRGDSGVGKTTLVERLSTAAGLEGASVSRVQCYELEREIPYSVVTGLVVGLLERPGVTATSPEALAELGRTVPQVRQRFPNLPPPVDSQGETARVRLAEAMHEMVLAIAEEHPVILVVDDLHLADDVSLAVLHLLIRRAKEQPIMVVMTVRPGELGQSPQAARLLEGAAGLGFQAIGVPPMNDEESNSLLDSVIQPGEAKPAGAARRALLRAAAGYPMVLELLVQDWQAHGEQSLALSLGAMTTELAQRTDAGAYDQLFARINRGLDPVTQTVLNLAAILGRRLNDVEMYSLLDLGLGHTVSGLAQLTNLRVLRDGSRGLEFVNELIRACAYQAVPSPIRRELHSRIADRLLARGPDATSQCGLEIAWHCIRSARLEEAVPYLLAGASEAIRSGAPHEAERALATGSAQFTGDVQTQAATLLAEALQEQGDWAGSIRVIEEVLPTVDGPNAEFLTVQLLFSQHNAQSATTLIAGEQLEQLWRVMESSTQPRNRLKAASVAANLIGTVGDTYAARRTYHLAAQISCPVPDDDLTLSVIKAVLANHCGDQIASMAHLKAATEIIDKQRFANSTAVRVHTGLGVHAHVRGCYEEAIPHHMTAYRLAQSLGNDVLMRGACLNLAVCHGRLGHTVPLIEWANKGKALLGPAFAGYNEVQVVYWKALGHALLSQPEEATTAMSFVDARLPADMPIQMWRLWVLMKADVLAVLGMPRQAVDTARSALRYDADMAPLPHYLGLFTRWAALAASGPDEDRAVTNLVVSLHPLRDNLAAVDTAEILAASTMVRRRLGLDVSLETGLLQSKLIELPPAVSQQLRRVGMIP